MKFHLDGSLEIKASPEKTYSSLCTPEFMVTTIPDLQSHKIIDENTFEAKAKVGFSIVRGTVDLKFFLSDKTPNAHAKLVGDGSGVGSKIHIDSVFDLSPSPNGTVMKWFAEADLSGVASGIGGNMLKSQSEKMVSQIFENIKKKLEESSPPS